MSGAVDPHPQSYESLAYQKAPGFKTSITIGENAPDGPAYELSDGRKATLFGSISSQRVTVLNFGSCS